ncbi:MAG: flagellin [Ferrovibrio sp.]|uniref:flagellin n=1 Tax=Ferrovibrio sp. TaxID=1917215 RepID=UPI002639E891|nr:flagellin [Ferrovibrio sp.]MCW0232535.1 flagellin [Ferrovibrio sp.]
MVALVGTTQYATQLDVTRNIRLLNLQLNKQNQQLADGRYADGLIGVSQRAQELGSLKSEVGTVNNYKSAVQTAQNRTNLYALTIEELIDIATEAQDTMIKNRDPFFAATSAPNVQANVLLDRVGSLLQTKDGDRFLFAGTNYTDNPINGAISGLATVYPAGAVPGIGFNTFVPFTAPAAFPGTTNYATANDFYVNPTATAPGTYDDFYNTTGTTLYSDDNEQMSYGVSAAEDGFQTMIDSIIRFRDATQDIATDPNNYQARVDDARDQLNTAITQLKTIASRNGYKQQQMKEVQGRHDRALDVLKVRIGGIENIDIGEVSVNIKNLQTTLEASYVITRDSLQLSLVNYLR